MLILALDLAKRSGFAIGRAGEVPHSGSWDLRRTGEPVEYEGPELVRRLQALVKDRRPDRIVVENWMQPHAQKHQAPIVAQLLLHGALNAWCGISRIKLQRVSPGTVRKHVCGKGNAGDRDATKAMVVRTVHLLGLMPKTCTDDNRADALVIWRWAEDCLAHVRGAMALVPA